MINSIIYLNIYYSFSMQKYELNYLKLVCIFNTYNSIEYINRSCYRCTTNYTISCAINTLRNIELLKYIYYSSSVLHNMTACMQYTQRPAQLPPLVYM